MMLGLSCFMSAAGVKRQAKPFSTPDGILKASCRTQQLLPGYVQLMVAPPHAYVESHSNSVS
jgi:hypothetical protein